MTRRATIASIRLDMRSTPRATIVAELAMLHVRAQALARHALRYRARMRAALERTAPLFAEVALLRREVELLRGADVELQRTAELLAEARANAVPQAPVEAPDARHWRERYEQAKSELRRAQALAEAKR